jgi:hypothetical protein
MNNFQSFTNPIVLENYIQSGQPLNIIDRTTDLTLFMFVCNQILQSQPYKPWVDIAMKMLQFTPEQINLSYANRDGVTALILVCGVDTDVSLKILSYGSAAVNLNAVEKDNKMNALMYSLTENTEEVALEMLEMSTIVISLENINKNGYTPLMIACEEGLEEVALSMLEKYPPYKLHLFQTNNSGQNAFDLAIQNEHMSSIYRLLNELMNEQETINNVKQVEWAHKEMPVFPSFTEQVIDFNTTGYDPFLLEDRIIKEYLDENPTDNIVIVYEGKNYLVSKSTIERQWEDAIVFECLQAEGEKNPSNIVQNLPLFNIKLIGIDIPPDKIGVWPEFIYLDGMKEIIDSKKQLFSILPLIDQMLVSVISLNEAKKWGSGEGSGYGALHCQNGQGGMAGVIIPAKANMTAGKKKSYKKNPLYKSKKRKTVKKRKTAKKRKRVKKVSK